MNDEKKTEDRLARLIVPPPGELVRSRALSAAREVFGAGPVPDAWDRIWFNPRYRLTWAAAVSLLVAGHILFPFGDADTRARKSQTPQYVNRVLGPDAEPELLAGLELPPIDRTARPGRSLNSDLR